MLTQQQLMTKLPITGRPPEADKPSTEDTMTRILSICLMLMLATTPVMALDLDDQGRLRQKRDVPSRAAGHVIDSKENPEYLFVLSASSGSYDGETLTLNDVPLVIYFSDRPERIAGHMSLEKFVESWGQGADGFKTDPPNATLSILAEEGSEDVVVELSNPVVQGNSIKLDVRVLNGKMPSNFDVCSLFVDGGGVTDGIVPIGSSSPKVVAEAPAEAMGTVYQT